MAAGYPRGVTAKKISTQRRVIDGVPVEIRRSTRRRRSVQAYRDGESVVVLMPAALAADERDEWARRMVERVLEQERRRDRAVPRGDEQLAERARELSEAYLDGRARPASIRWVGNQRTRWGSCTPSTGQIRLSDRLQRMPPWVIDYVIVHELTHLLVPGHGPRFRELCERYPHTLKAQGFLDGVAFAAGTLPAGTAPDDIIE